ncbi:flagellin [Crassaminicella profunda]|uniref:flagellin N-terminal helical domain-containing protein n=1 Tax=Crassaminicella profunda TaxID=1286698 RepID=UPI001CA6EFDB|nr:flagellin [Crassaminicella profunda]QZY54297.1 flagellin [Crassaminicella profunda]
MIINHNMNALYAYRNMMVNAQRAGRAMERLSSGLRINRAADDPAGLCISERMRVQIRGLHQASRNAQDGISLLQTGEGALGETHAILQRMRELAVQAANGTNTDEDRNEIQNEINQLTSEINRIGNNTEFNTKKLLKGEDSPIHLQVGANKGQKFPIYLKDMRAEALGIAQGEEQNEIKEDSQVVFNTKAEVTNGDKKEHGLDVSNHENATAAIEVIDQATKKVSRFRSSLGAYQNRLEYTIDNLENTAENLAAAESRIRDADMAKEMMEYAKYNMLHQVAMAMLAQANKQPEYILQLLRQM